MRAASFRISAVAVVAAAALVVPAVSASASAPARGKAPVVTAARISDPLAACAVGSARPWVRSTTPTLRATLTDPDGQAVSATFAVVDSRARVVWASGATGQQASGQSHAVTVPEGQARRRWHVHLAGHRPGRRRPLGAAEALPVHRRHRTPRPPGHHTRGGRAGGLRGGRVVRRRQPARLVHAERRVDRRGVLPVPVPRQRARAGPCHGPDDLLHADDVRPADAAGVCRRPGGQREREPALPLHRRRSRDRRRQVAARRGRRRRRHRHRRPADAHPEHDVDGRSAGRARRSSSRTAHSSSTTPPTAPRPPAPFSTRRTPSPSRRSCASTRSAPRAPR